ncbi:hypothetical protein [Sphingosinithalassobacter portus]|uniref:hypothetical protein n=1 Tax=Stakelama portus TaxID=2676234 RepID=UPI0011AB8320|nr:hypothetical protein [Sphingosinithalassobacter portus]
MRVLVGLTCMILALAPAQAAAQLLKLKPGEAATVRLSPHVTATAPEAATMTPFDTFVFSQIAPEIVDTDEGQMVTMDDAALMPNIAPGAIRLRFLAVPGHSDMLLIVENGYDRAVRYRARMTVGDERVDTSTCIVPGKHPGIEHWPHGISEIALSDFRLIDGDDGREPCF